MRIAISNSSACGLRFHASLDFQMGRNASLNFAQARGVPRRNSMGVDFPPSIKISNGFCRVKGSSQIAQEGGDPIDRKRNSVGLQSVRRWNMARNRVFVE
jgi:hypothetical protein